MLRRQGLIGARAEAHHREAPLRLHQVPAAHQLVHDLLDALERDLAHSAVPGSVEQVELPDLLGIRTMQHIGNERLAKAPTRRGDHPQGGERDVRHILDLVVRQTVGAVSAPEAPPVSMPRAPSSPKYRRM